MNKIQFISYLEDTLIPDLKASGHNETAKDFETCVKYIRDAMHHVQFTLETLGLDKTSFPDNDPNYDKLSPSVRIMREYLDS